MGVLLVCAGFVMVDHYIIITSSCAMGVLLVCAGFVMVFTIPMGPKSSCLHCLDLPEMRLVAMETLYCEVIIVRCHGNGCHGNTGSTAAAKPHHCVAWAGPIRTRIH